MMYVKNLYFNIHKKKKQFNTVKVREETRSFQILFMPGTGRK